MSDNLTDIADNFRSIVKHARKVVNAIVFNANMYYAHLTLKYNLIDDIVQIDDFLKNNEFISVRFNINKRKTFFNFFDPFQKRLNLMQHKIINTIMAHLNNFIRC